MCKILYLNLIFDPSRSPENDVASKLKEVFRNSFKNSKFLVLSIHCITLLIAFSDALKPDKKRAMMAITGVTIKGVINCI